MAWFKRQKKRIEQPTPADERRVRTEGLWIKCDACRSIIWKKDLQANWQVCSKCDFHFRLGAKRRVVALRQGQSSRRDLPALPRDGEALLGGHRDDDGEP